MKHSVDELFAIVYQYYPPGLAWDDPQYRASEATRKLRAARIEASAGEAYERWLAMARRIHARFPSTDWMSYSTFLPTGDIDGSYIARLFLPTVPETHIAFLVSFLAPYYVIYRQSWVTIPGTAGERRTDWPEEVHRDCGRLAESSFELRPEDEPYASVIAAEIEAAYPGYELMPPEVGKELVLDVCLNMIWLGSATIYDCLFTERW